MLILKKLLKTHRGLTIQTQAGSVILRDPSSVEVQTITVHASLFKSGRAYLVPRETKSGTTETVAWLTDDVNAEYMLEYENKEDAVAALNTLNKNMCKILSAANKPRKWNKDTIALLAVATFLLGAGVMSKARDYTASIPTASTTTIPSTCPVIPKASNANVTLINEGGKLLASSPVADRAGGDGAKPAEGVPVGATAGQGVRPGPQESRPLKFVPLD